MNDPQDQPDEIAPPVIDEAGSENPAPKRRRAPRAVAAASAEASEAAAEGSVEAAAPAPRRRVRKAVEASDAAAAASPADAVADASAETTDKPVRARRTGRLAVSAPAAQAVLALDDVPPAAAIEATPAAEPVVVAVAQAPVLPAAIPSTDDVADGAVAQDAAGSEDGPAAASEGRERGRRRDRRERRGGDRGDRGEAGEERAGEGDVARFTIPPMAPVADAAACFDAVVSGQYDVESPEAAQAPADEATEQTDDPGKRVLRPEPEAPKLHKVLAAAGIGSRRDMEALIEEGQVTVNGEVAHQGMRITHGDQVRVSGRPVKVRIAPPPARVLAYHKPVGEVVTHNDPEGRPTVFKRLPRLPQGKWLSVGRLDLNTEGLLLFTNSGELANQLMHPRFGVEREYAVRVLGELTPDLKAQLLEGVEIEGQKAGFKAIEDGGGGEGANHWWRVVITEGRNREVRKLFDAVGLTVSRLIRIRYGTVVLPRGLKRGVWVELDDNDVRLIRRLAGGDARRQGQPGPQGQGQQGGRPGQPGPGQGQPQGQGKGGKHNKQRGRNGQPLQGGGQPRGPQQGPYGNQPPRGPRPEQGGGMPRQAQPYDDDREPDDPLHIPNPLEQTFDRRFATGSKRIVAGFGRPSDPSRDGPAPRVKGEPRQPDPMQTSVGYIGADAYFRKPGGGGGGGGGGNKRGRRR